MPGRPANPGVRRRRVIAAASIAAAALAGMLLPARLVSRGDGPGSSWRASEARAAEIETGLRVREGGGYDSNLFELVDAKDREGDLFLRRQADAELTVRGLLPAGRLSGAVRGLVEQYGRFPAEDRRQGEVTLAWSAAQPRLRRRVSIDGGLRGRDYPDSALRTHWQAWGRLTGAVPVGPVGSLVGRCHLWTLDFRRTARRDRSGASFDLAYEHPVGRRWIATGGLELGTSNHGYPSLRLEADGESPNRALVYGRDREDRARFLHLGLRRAGRLLAQAQYGYRTQRSNSVDGRYDRHEVSWLLARPLWGGVTGQFLGHVGWTRYTDPSLEEFDITRVGEVEAGEEDNTIALRLSRRLLPSLSADLRVAWYRNESAVVGEYYDKAVPSAGITWGWGSGSDF